MVQIIKGGTQKRDSDERLGYAMGKSISDTLLNFGANKALDSVINDESLKDAAPSERLSKLQQALAPYGDKGKEVFGHRLMIEEQRYKEREQETLAKAMEGKPLSSKEKGYLSPQSTQQLKKAKQNQIFGKLLNGQDVSAEEKDYLDPEQRIRYEAHERSKNKVSKPTQASQPIDPDQERRIEEIEDTEEFKKASPSQKTSMLRRAGVSKENASDVVKPFIEEEKINEKKFTREGAEFDRAYEAQKEFIDETTKTYKAFETDIKPKLMQMRNIPDEDIVTPTKAVFLESLGIPYGALEKPGSELYNKLSLDLLKGLPETYGSRILKVEVDNFLKTIPSLMNSPDGRRMIASNMLKLGEMKEVYYNEMRTQQKEALDSGKPLPKDFQQRVFDQVKPQIDRINNEFVKMAEVTSVPKGTKPYFASDGEIYFVPDGEQGKELIQREGLKRIW